jgi:hypothetical protein
MECANVTYHIRRKNELATVAVGVTERWVVFRIDENLNDIALFNVGFSHRTFTPQLVARSVKAMQMVPRHLHLLTFRLHNISQNPLDMVDQCT